MLTLIKEVTNKTLRPLGYEIQNVRRVRVERDGWAQYKFVKPDGSFDYHQYRKLQERKSLQDRDAVWVSEENIFFLSNYLRQHLGGVHFGICHGSKRGREQEWFAKYLGGDTRVIGTDIAEWAKDFPNTVQWDFHEVRADWIDAADFIYSNALDHAHDPHKAIEAWMSCVRPGGYCIIEWSIYGESANITDPFSADLVQLVYAVTRWGKGRYCVRELIPTPANPEFINFVVMYRLA